MAELYVVRTFPAWREASIAILREHYDVATKSMTIPDDKIVGLLKPVMASVKDKSVLKKVIPFVMELKAKLLAQGPKVLNRALPFDEAALLAENMDALIKSIGLMSISVKTEANDDESAKKFEASVPGAPSFKLFRK